MRTTEPLIDIAVAVGDGAGVDWDRVERQSDPSARPIVRQLRLLEKVASVHAAEPVTAFERSLNQVAAFAVPPSASADQPSTWGALTLIERLGGGSYADVYLAHDPRLDRPVALKLLRQVGHTEIGGTEAIEEARLLARVRHPNVVTVYGAERIDGRTGIWMEYVDGRTLEHELRERGPLPVHEIVAIGLALSGAVEAVHAAGLLHRDIKAQNVMRARDGRVLLADFGATREVTRETGGLELAGTPLYLAPEILRGGPASAASDIYSLGVLLYYLATGSFPISGRSLRDLRDAHSTAVRVPVSMRRTDLPKPVAAIIQRATESAPERRQPSAAAIGSKLASAARARFRPWAIAATVALAASAAIAWTWSRPTDRQSPQLVIVSRFENQTGDARLDDVVEVAFSQELMQSRSVAVVPRERIEDTLRLMKRPAPSFVDPAIAREVALRDGSINLVATGRIDRASEEYAIHVAINAVSTGTPVAQASVRATDLNGVLPAIRALTWDVRRAIDEDDPQVTADARLERVSTVSLDALRDYSAGMAFINEFQWRAAEGRMSAAIQKDPDFSAALIMLAHCLYNQRRPRAEVLQLARRAFDRTAGLPRHERYFIEGSYYLLVGHWSRATTAFEALVREHPYDYWGLNNLAAAYQMERRYGEEISIVRQLALVRPNSPRVLYSVAARLIAEGNHLEEASRLVARATPLARQLEETSYYNWFRMFPPFEAWAQGDVLGAAALLDQIEHSGYDDGSAWILGQLNLMLGRVRAAERAFRTVAFPGRRDAWLAQSAFARGDTSGARAALTRAVPELIATRNLSGNDGISTSVCWMLLRTDLPDDCQQLSELPPLSMDPLGWIKGELAAARGDTSAAMSILNGVLVLPAGNSSRLIALDTLAGIYEQRGDLAAAESVLRMSDGARSALYAGGGSNTWYWLMARAHLLEIERRLGRGDRVAEMRRELQELLAAADPDFILWRAVQ